MTRSDVCKMLLVAALLAQVVTLAPVLYTEGRGSVVLGLRGVLVAVVLTGSLGYLVVVVREGSDWLAYLALLLVGGASVVGLTVSHAALVLRLPLHVVMSPGYLLDYPELLAQALTLAVAVDVSVVALARTLEADEISRPAYLKIEAEVSEALREAKPSARPSRQVTVWEAEGGWFVGCSCGWGKGRGPYGSKLSATKAGNAHTRCRGD